MKFDVKEFESSSENVMQKTIEKGNEIIAYTLLQQNLYTFKEKSIIRELSSNAKDSIGSRDTAISIINGTSKVEDHFEDNGDSEIYAASKWNPAYYNTEYLSDDMNVYITITKLSDKAIVSIKDNGCGLGGDNLRGFFNLNYSTKRCNKDVLGAFGIGSKSPLSLVDNFDVVTRYNGYQSRFKVTLGNTIPLTPKFSNGKKNKMDYLIMPTEETKGIESYWEETTEKNGLESIIEIKLSSVDTFIDAAKAQLMYMPNVVVKVKSGTNENLIDVSADIMYRDENCIISKNTVYTVPHLLLGAGDTLINYGPIDFAELQKEPKTGSVGLIIDASKITVTPNRESIVWDDKAAAEITRVYDLMANKAKNYIQTSLQSADDFLEWLHITSVTTSDVSRLKGNSTIAAFAKVIDVKDMDSFPYPNDASINFFRTLDRQFGTGVTFHNFISGSASSINRAANFVLDSMYYMDVPRDKYKHKYINAIDGTFTYFFVKEEDMNKPLVKLLLNSKFVKRYSDVTIPDDVLQAYKDAELDKDITSSDSGTGGTKKVDKSVLNVKILRGTSASIYKYNKKEFIADPFYYYNDNIVVGTQADRPDLVQLHEHVDELRDVSQNMFLSYHAPYSSYMNNLRQDKHAILMINKKDYKGLPFGRKLKTLYSYYIKDYKNGIITLSDEFAFLLTLWTVGNTSKYDRYLRTFRTFSYTPDGEKIRQYCDFYKSLGINLYDQPEWVKAMRDLVHVSSGLVDDPVLKEKALKTLDENLPDFMCENIDEISDVVGFNMDYYKDVMENVFSSYTDEELKTNYLISSVRSSVLKEINYKFPIENDKIQKGFDTENKVLLGQAIPIRFRTYFSENIHARHRFKEED